MPLSAALYARTPDPTQPIAIPIGRLRAYIAGQGWTLADEHVFADCGYSGLVFERPGLEAMLAALQRGEFVRLVAERPDALSRTLSDRWYIENTAARMGCRIVYLEEERAGPLVVTGAAAGSGPGLARAGLAEAG